MADEDGTERNLGVVAHRPSSIEKLLKKVGSKERIHAVYEAGPTGYQSHLSDGFVESMSQTQKYYNLSKI